MFAADEFRLVMSRRQWRRMMRDLAARGGGRRESGAFLLADVRSTSRRIEAWIPFDEIDPNSLNGAIHIRGEAFGRLWAACRERGLRVVADVHTHPGDGVAQSSVDAANPMIAQRGHVAIIAPRFAQGPIVPRDIGYHVYTGRRSWENHFDADAAARLRLVRGPGAPSRWPRAVGTRTRR